MKIHFVRTVAMASFFAGVLPVVAHAQVGLPGSSVARRSSSNSSGAELGVSAGSSTLAGSIPTGSATAEVMNLTLLDVVSRALRYNLALAESGEDERFRRAQRLIALSDLLPELNIRPTATGQQVNLAAFGFSGLAGIPQVVGPFAVLDARASVTQTLFDLKKRRTVRADRENETVAAELSTDLRSRVSVFVAGLYLQGLAAKARIETQRTQVQTAESILQQANDRHDAGTVPRIDVLRAEVQVDEERNRFIIYEGEYEKRKIDLGRAIGLPGGQAIELTDSMPDEPLPSAITLEATLAQAYMQRSDFSAAQSSVKAAEYLRSAAEAGRYPTADVEANYGVIGASVTNMHGTFGVAAGVTIPVFQGGKTQAEVVEADTVVRRRQAELSNLRGKIEGEVRTAFTDLRSSARQVEVATRAAGLAREQLSEAQSRFAAGVTNNLEVVQAQQSTAVANENYINALFSLNVAKAAFLLSRGDAENTIQQFLGRAK